jgi:hypothetical protein
VRRHAAAALILTAVLAASACGSDDSKTTGAASRATTAKQSPLAASASRYCDVARGWAVRELTPHDENDPAQLEPYWNEYLRFMADGLASAPDEIGADWKVYEHYVNGVMTPVITKYGYSTARMEKEATPEEQKVSQGLPDDVNAAWKRIIAYEAEPCGAQGTPAADVKFDGPAADAYCGAKGKQDEANQAAVEAGATPAAVRELFTGAGEQQRATAMADAAPPAIRADVVATNSFERDAMLPLLAKYDYDVRRLILKGTAADRAIFWGTDPRVRSANARLHAYADQLCSGEKPAS